MSAGDRVLRVAMVTEQLRRATPGGIGRYVDSLDGALADVDAVTIERVHGRLPTELTTRLWELGLPIHTRADVLHTTSFAIPRMLPTRPMTAFVHDVLWRGAGATTLNARGAAFHERGLRHVRDKARLVFVPSHTVAASLRDAGIPADRIRITGEGSDHLPNLARHEQEPFLLSVGTFEPRKNLATLLHAYAIVRGQLPDCPRLRLVGSGDWRGAPGLPSVLPEGVEVVGAVPDHALAGLLAGATAFVFPSLAEGFGLPPMEAMRAGVPVISSAVPSVVERADDLDRPVGQPIEQAGAHRSGHVELVEPADPTSIASAIVRVLQSPDRRRELSEAGRQWAAASTWERVAARHIQGWRELA